MLSNENTSSTSRTGTPPKIHRLSFRQRTLPGSLDRPTHQTVRQHSFAWLRAALLAAAAVAFFILVPDPAQASACGGRGERACCVLDSNPGCESGLSEYVGCSGDCNCGYSWPANGWNSSGTCWSPSACGGNGQRACCVGESSGACRAGLVEQPGCAFGEECQCGDSAWGIRSSGTCRAVTLCGGEGQRACCVGEAGSACGAGLTEKPGCTLGDEGCQCGSSVWGVKSSGMCVSVTQCGGEGQRACCVGESSSACGDGLTEKPDCTLGGEGCQCGNSVWGIQSSGMCVPVTRCGGVDERACCVGESSSACGTGLIEAPGCDISGDGCQCEDAIWGVDSSGMCRATTSCGGPHQRACCLSERIPSCDAGLVEVLGCDFGEDCQCGDSLWGIQSVGTCRPVTPFTTESWMEYALSKNPRTRLRDVLIPESHDAGSYGITNASAWDSVYVDSSLELSAAQAAACLVSPVSSLCWDFENIVGDVVKSWAVTQYTNLYSQLYAGARSFDLRTKSWNGGIHIVHGIAVAETTLQTVLDDIALFAQDHPKEIIFIDFRPPTGSESLAADMILDTLGPHIADVTAFSPATLTVGHVWDSGGSIVLLARDGFETWVPGALDREAWTAGDRYNGTTDPSAIKAYAAGQLETADDELDLLLQLSLCTTTSSDEIIEAEIKNALLNFLTGGLVNPNPSIYERDGGVRGLRDDWLREWLQDPEKSRAANIFLIDFVPQASDFIDEIIGENQARFFSDEFSVDQDGVLTGDLLAGAANALGATVVIDSTQTLGAVTDYGDGTFGYDPNGQFALSRGETATDTFTYEVTYASGSTASATATFTVTGSPHIDSLNYSDVEGIDFYFVSDTGLCADAVGNNDQYSGPNSVMRLRDCDSVDPEFFRWTGDGRIRSAWTNRYLMTHNSGQIRHYKDSTTVWEYTADRKIRRVGESRCMTYGSEGGTVTWVSCDSSNVGRWSLIRKPDDSGTEGVPFYFATDDGLCADASGDNNQHGGSASKMYLRDCATVSQEFFQWTNDERLQTSWTTRYLMKHSTGQLRHYAGSTTTWDYTLNGKVRTEFYGDPYCVDHGAPGELITVVSCDDPGLASWKLLESDGSELMVRGEELIPTGESP